MALDQHGQPQVEAFNRTRCVERDVTELLGIAKGMLADGIVSEPEAIYLRKWIEQHREASDQFPIRHIRERLERIFANGKVDEVERMDLFELLSSFTGGDAGVVSGEDASCDLPCDQPPPKLKWSDSLFVFTGKFAFGAREQCEREVLTRGARCGNNITKQTNYVIVGTFASRDWIKRHLAERLKRQLNTATAVVRLQLSRNTIGSNH